MSELQVQLARYFPIESQTSQTDKEVILTVKSMVAKFKQNYSYVEIGSYLGGSLTPFLMDSSCELIFSIDERERQQPDERGAKFDYAGVTNQTMIDNLKKHGINTDKLQTFDGSVDAYRSSGQAFDVALIDGEHTDFACFRDFLWLLPMMKTDSLVMFHDSALVYKALRLIQLYLKKMEIPYRFMKKANSEMSIILMGEFAGIDTFAEFGQEEKEEDFYSSSETAIIQHLVKNRVEVQFSCKIVPPKTVTMF